MNRGSSSSIIIHRAITRLRSIPPHVPILVLILAWAGFVRIWRCDASPPGIHSDEASNAWNAWCLLHTGRDEWGQRWPVFYTRAFDDYRSPLYLYLLLPFQWIGGMNICTTRLPAVIGGVVTVWLVYVIGRRMFDRPVGLVAAAALAVMPWHIQHTRWGHEGNLTPLLFAAAIAALLWAGVPLANSPPRPRIRRCVIAGALAGLVLYGYAAIRLVLPATLLAGAFVAAPALVRAARNSASRRALICGAAAFAAVAAPLAVKHLTDPLMNTRARQVKLWTDNDTAAQRAGRVAARYLAHFDPSFLFVRGSFNPSFAPPRGYGLLHGYMLPLVLIGVAAALLRSLRRPSSASARVLLVMLLCYPAGDALFGEATVLGMLHTLRSSPGVVPLALLIGLGTVVTVRWLASRRRRALGLVCAAALFVIAGWTHATFLRQFFGPYNDDPVTAWIRNVDLYKACQRIKPDFDQYDAVFCTAEGIHPYAVTLVALQYSPQDWFAAERQYVRPPPPFQTQVCGRYGTVHLLYDPDVVRRVMADMEARGKRPARVAMILRPQESALAGGRQPVYVIYRGGWPLLLVYDFTL